MTSPNRSEVTLAEKQAQLAQGRLDFARNDGNEQLLGGETAFSWDSAWDLTNLMRYAHCCRMVYEGAVRLNQPHIRVLDVGCSSATWASFWRWKYKSPRKAPMTYLGLEYDQATVVKGNAVCAALYCANAKSSASVQQHDLITQSLPDWSPDIILANEVIEHIPRQDGERLVREAFAALPVNGTLVISTPSPKKDQDQQFIWESDHVFEWSLPELTELLEQTGFKIAQVRGWHSDKHSRKTITPEQLRLYRELRTISTGVASAIIGHLYPELSNCVCVTAYKPEDL